MFTSPLLSKSRFIRKSGKVCRPQRHTPRTAQHLIMLMVALIANFALTAAVSVRNIEFSQDTCSPVFSGLRGGTVTDIPERFNTIIKRLGKSPSKPDIEDLLAGNSVIRDAIEVVQMKCFDKHWFSANNRRLLLFKMISEHYDIDFVPPQVQFSIGKGKLKKRIEAKKAFRRKYGHEFTANADYQECHTIELRGSTAGERDAEKRLRKIPSFRTMCLPDLETDDSSDSEMPVTVKKTPSVKSKQKSTSTTTSDGAGYYGWGGDAMTKKSTWDDDDFMRRRLNALLELTAK